MDSPGVPSAAEDPHGGSILHRLRRLFVTQAASSARSADMPAVQAAAWPAGMRVLVADDNPLNLMVASEMLAYFGIHPLLAADGAEAVAMTAATRLDLILMDLQMPVLDGIGASRQIRRLEWETARARVPVVAYTSAATTRLHLSDYGIDDVLAKPCEMPAMQACLLRWCPRQTGAAAPRDEAPPHRQ